MGSNGGLGRRGAGRGARALLVMGGGWAGWHRGCMLQGMSACRRGCQLARMHGVHVWRAPDGRVGGAQHGCGAGWRGAGHRGSVWPCAGGVPRGVSPEVRGEARGRAVQPGLGGGGRACDAGAAAKPAGRPLQPGGRQHVTRRSHRAGAAQPPDGRQHAASARRMPDACIIAAAGNELGAPAALALCAAARAAALQVREYVSGAFLLPLRALASDPAEDAST